MVFVTHNRPLDSLLQLKDAGAVTATATAQVGGVDAVIDLGSSKFVKGLIIFDVTAIDVASNDEVYQLTLQGTNTAGFGGTVYEMARKIMGANAVTGLGANTATGRQVLYFDNVAQVAAGEYVPQRYIRLRTICLGTTPSINYLAWAAVDA